MKNSSLLLIILVLLSNTTTKSQDYELNGNSPNPSTSKQDRILGQVDKFFVDSIIVYSVVNGNSKMTYQYDESGRRVLDQKEIWNNDQWIGKERYSCKYKQDKKVFEMTEVWAEGQWLGKERYSCIYEDKIKVSDLTEIWKDGQWIGKERNAWKFNEDAKMTYSLKEIWNNGLWEGSIRDTWTYNNSGNSLLYLKEIYNNNEWKASRRTNWIYDSLGKLIRFKSDTLIIEEGYDYMKTDIDHIYVLDSNSKIIYSSKESWKWYNIVFNYRFYRRTVDSFDTRGNQLYHLSLLQSESPQNNDEYYIQSWTYDNNNMILSYCYQDFKDSDIIHRHSYTYDTNGYKLSDIYDWHNNNIWFPQNKWSWTYNSDGDTLSTQYDTWKTQEFVPEYKISSDYNNKKPVQVLRELWQNSTWIPNEKLLFFYNDKDTIIKITLEKWKDSNWVKSKVYSWYYDSSGHNTIYKQEDNTVTRNGNWEIIFIETKNYASNESGTFLTKWYSERWFGDAGKLFPEKEQRWTYSNKGKLLERKYSEYTLPDMVYHHEGGWFKGDVTNYSYDDNGYITKYKHQTWSREYGYKEKWTTVFSYNYIYDEFGNFLLISSDNGDTNWVERKLSFKDKVGFKYSYDCYKIEVFYTMVTGVEEQSKQVAGDFLIYPNPVNDFCNIDYKSNSNQNIEIKIINIEGKILFSTAQNVSVGDNLLQLNTSEISNGVYFVLITSNNEQRKGIMIK